MGRVFVEIQNLPDEILLTIFRNLPNIDVLFALIGTGGKLDRVAHDSNFTSSLTLYQRLSDNEICSLPDPILDRFCSEILPEIDHKIKCLCVETTSIERILRAASWPHLHQLNIYGIDLGEAISLFNNSTVFTQLIKNQISSLVLDITRNERGIQTTDINSVVFRHILSMFTNLQRLNFNPSSFWYNELSFDISPLIVHSSILLELHVRVGNFTDCLCLLDGRFPQLQAFHVHIFQIFAAKSTVTDQKKLVNLKCFSLYCDNRTHVYDELVLPLLHRMRNLERLNLHLKVDRYIGFVDGNDLKKNIISDMPWLVEFTFNIRSFNRSPNQVHIRTNEDIQNTFNNFPIHPIISSVDYFQERQYSQCHIYSYPYRVEFYQDITNHFPGGSFPHVTTVSLDDDRPFEHEFFVRIEKSFPFMQELNVYNKKSQKNKCDRRSNGNNQEFSMIKYSHLTLVNLLGVHDDYIEQFLIDTKMCLPNNVDLLADYLSLKRVTHNFRRDATRINCAKINYFCSTIDEQLPEHFNDYFAQIYVSQFC